MTTEAIKDLPKKQPGLLSLLYWIKYDPAYNSAFHDDQLTTMELFGIGREDPIAQAMVAIGEVHSNPEQALPLIAELVAKYLPKEILEQKPQFW